MIENQDIEFKSIWKDDKGRVIGVNNAIKLVN